MYKKVTLKNKLVSGRKLMSCTNFAPYFIFGPFLWSYILNYFRLREERSLHVSTFFLFVPFVEVNPNFRYIFLPPKGPQIAISQHIKYMCCNPDDFYEISSSTLSCGFIFLFIKHSRQDYKTSNLQFCRWPRCEIPKNGINKMFVDKMQTNKEYKMT